MNKKRKSSYILEWAKKVKGVKLLGGKCICCGESEISLLTFHHKDPVNKKYDINDIRTLRWSIFREEILKCVLMCHNCHGEVHNKGNSKQSVYSKKKYLEYKNTDSCIKCGYKKNNGVLAFHHIKKEEKKFSLSSKFCNPDGTIPEEVKEELDKCTVLCANCHAKEHLDQEKLDKYLNEIHEKAKNYKELPKKYDRELIITMYNDGYLQKDIVEKLNCAKSTVSMILTEYRKKNNDVYSQT